MKVVNVCEQYFAAQLTYQGVPRRGARVMLIARSDAGTICYEAAVSFFPHEDPEDFAVSYDACFSETLFAAKGRRSKKREEALLAELPVHIDRLAEAQGGRVDWDRPLTEARRG